MTFNFIRRVSCVGIFDGTAKLENCLSKLGLDKRDPLLFAAFVIVSFDLRLLCIWSFLFLMNRCRVAD